MVRMVNLCTLLHVCTRTHMLSLCPGQSLLRGGGHSREYSEVLSQRAAQLVGGEVNTTAATVQGMEGGEPRGCGAPALLAVHIRRLTGPWPSIA